MQRFWLSFLGLVCASPLLTAGQVYGTLRDGAGKGMAGVDITIVSAAKVSYTGKTAADGTYQIFVKENGKCELQANVGGKAPATASVFSYAEPAKYEFEVVGGNLKVK
ncbi:MAG: carboxypeptidase-like regulatory domain-containing protein [Bryobacteraceae bacterium]